jgi:hypothetical protein
MKYQRNIKYIVKWIINVSVFCVCFFLLFNILGDYISKLISLKIKNIKTEGVITNLKESGYHKTRDLKIEYIYEYMGERYNGKISISYSILRKIDMIIMFDDYYVGQKINVLVRPDNTFSYLEKELDSQISGEIFVLLFLPFLVTLIAAAFLNKYFEKANKNNKKQNKKPLYKYYIQENDYKIKETLIGEKITLDDIDKYVNYGKLKSGDIICCGISNKNDFVEISFFENEYQLRICKDGDEKTKEIKASDDNSIINEIIYKNMI